jgi:hypothetical protein
VAELSLRLRTYNQRAAAITRLAWLESLDETLKASQARLAELQRAAEGMNDPLLVEEVRTALRDNGEGRSEILESLIACRARLKTIVQIENIFNALGWPQQEGTS